MEPKAATDKQLQYLQRAAQCAFRSNMTQRHGCVIVNPDGEVVATGYNYKTVYHCHQYSTHAEVNALSKLKKSADLTHHQMYVVRLSNALSSTQQQQQHWRQHQPQNHHQRASEVALKSSMPCEACMEAITKKRLRKVWYSHGQA